MSYPIITVGICPVWDITNYVDGIEWGQHKVISSQTVVPAGKALNVSKALAKLSIGSVAAGLWGKSDYQQLVESISDISDFVDLKPTVVEGRTRQNITVVDTKGNREIHLRARSTLTTKDNLNLLKKDLVDIIVSGSTAVFAGSMPDRPLLDDYVAIVKAAIAKGARIVIDTSGSALAAIAELSTIHLIKPNLEELSQLVGRGFNDDISAIVDAARTLCENVEVILVSMGAKGALVVTKEEAIHCFAEPSGHKVVNTVACGDYLLAGFISELNKDLCRRLQTAVRLSAARAWGLTEAKDCRKVIDRIAVETRHL